MKCKHCGVEAIVHGDSKETVNDFYCRECYIVHVNHPEYFIDCPHCGLEIQV